MSVIAWDRKIVAADKLANRNEIGRLTTKLIPHNDCVLAGVGSEESARILIDWYIAGADPDKWPECQRDEDHWSNLMVFDKDGCRFTSLWPKFIEVQDPFFAWGSGGDLALGAMAAGKDAIGAVEIACEYSVSCGLGIDAYDLETMRKIK